MRNLRGLHPDLVSSVHGVACQLSNSAQCGLVSSALGSWRRYNFSRWVVELGTESPELQRLLPPTDIRRRRDVRALDSGRYEQASMEYSLLSTPAFQADHMTSAAPHAQLIG